MTQNDTKKTNLKKTTKKIGEKQQTNSLELSKTKFSQKNDHWNHILEFLDYKKVVSCKQISKEFMNKLIPSHSKWAKRDLSDLSD